MIKEPLYLPKGSIRAIIALILTVFICFAVYKKAIIDEYIMVLWASIVGYYFASRSNTKEKK